MAKVRPTTIVVPVYGDIDSLKDCVKSLQEHVDTSRHRIMFVNDCGPEVDELEEYLHTQVKDRDGWEYYRNPANLGFVGTCNRAVMELDHTGNNVLLLNSDTVVTSGFLEEMQTILVSSSWIGMVSPRTNSGTLATIPIAATAMPLSERVQHSTKTEQARKIYDRIHKELPRHSVVPVVHGFCMLIRREVVDRYGLFDPVFGKGYGEEVDFCLRVKRGGYLSVLANHAYVHHYEARSFSVAAKNELLTENDRIIKSRHPEHSAVIERYIQSRIDPVDKFADSITRADDTPRVLVDLSGFQQLNERMKQQANEAMSYLHRWLDENTILHYLLDGPRPDWLKRVDNQTFNQKTLRHNTYDVIYRPFHVHHPADLVRLNRHGAKIITTLTRQQCSRAVTNTSEYIDTTSLIADTFRIADAVVVPDKHLRAELASNGRNIPEYMLRRAVRPEGLGDVERIRKLITDVLAETYDLAHLRERWDYFARVDDYMDVIASECPEPVTLRFKRLMARVLQSNRYTERAAVAVYRKLGFHKRM